VHRKTEMRNWLIILVIIACGCSVLAPPAVDPPTAKKSYVIPFEISELHVPIVSGVININPDHPEVHPSARRLAIDTGAAHTAFFVSNSIVVYLSKILPHATVQERLAADGAIVRVCHVPNARVTVGDLSVDMPVDASGRDMTVDPGFDGVVGIDFLSRFNVQMDFQAKTMKLIER
jgi:hypothetical protein